MKNNEYLVVFIYLYHYLILGTTEHYKYLKITEMALLPIILIKKNMSNNVEKSKSI